MIWFVFSNITCQPILLSSVVLSCVLNIILYYERIGLLVLSVF